jgi:transposase InsO family protein
VQRNVTAAEPDRRYVADSIPRRAAPRRTEQGWLYLAVVLDAFSRRVVGWAIADHLRRELVVDALPMGLGSVDPHPGVVNHSGHSARYAGCAFGHRLGEAGLPGSRAHLDHPRAPGHRRLGYLEGSATPPSALHPASTCSTPRRTCVRQ